jgi:RNA polymerase sigma factor (TIGR02999 family)
VKPSPQTVTRWLIEWSNGDETALQKLMPLVYAELRQRAHRYMARENPGHSLQTTALIHEAYLRLADQKDKQWQNRSHFFAVAAQAMRHILVDYARSRNAARRGGAARVVSIEEAAVVSEERTIEIVELDEALETLAKVDPRKSRIVELRFFGGLSVEETAEVLNVSSITVMRDWNLAKAWLHRELSKTESTKDE